MAVTRKFWRILETSLLVYPIFYAVFPFSLLGYFLKVAVGDWHSDLESELFLGLGVLAPFASTIITIKPRSRLGRIGCHVISLNCLGMMNPLSLFAARSAVTERVAFPEIIWGEDPAAILSMLKLQLYLQLIVLPWAWFSLRFIINRRHPLPSAIASSEDSSRPPHLT